MAIRTIDAPGIEIHEIDKSQYSPAMTGTKVLVTGFANSGEDYIPMIFTSKSAWLNYYGEPDNEAERYFYAASMEVLNQNGVVNCCKLPYDNEARDKFVGFKYKLNTTKQMDIKKVIEQISPGGALSSIGEVIDQSQQYQKDLVSFFLAQYNVTDATDKENLSKVVYSKDTVSAQFALEENVNVADRSDGQDGEGKNFLDMYADGESFGNIEKAFREQISKSSLMSYANEVDLTTSDILPKMNVYWKNTVVATETQWLDETSAFSLGAITVPTTGTSQTMLSDIQSSSIEDLTNQKVRDGFMAAATNLGVAVHILTECGYPLPEDGNLIYFRGGYGNQSVQQVVDAFGELSAIALGGSPISANPQYADWLNGVRGQFLMYNDVMSQGYAVKSGAIEVPGKVTQDISVLIPYFKADTKTVDFQTFTASAEYLVQDPQKPEDYIIDSIDDLGIFHGENLDPSGDDALYAEFQATPAMMRYDEQNTNGFNVYYQEGIKWLKLRNVQDIPETAREEIVKIASSDSYNLVELGETQDAELVEDYVSTLNQDLDALEEGFKDTIKDKLLFNEIRQADDTMDIAWKIESSGSPSLYDMTTIDEYRTDESRVATNVILVVDKTRKPYTKVPEDKEHKNDGRELIGVIPIITTAANALYAQSMIAVDDTDVTDYETIRNLQTLDASTSPYTYLGKKYETHNVMEEGQLSTVSVISQRLNNVHTEDDNDDDFFDSLALQANGYFSPISLQADGSFDRENMKKIGLVVVKAFLDASEGNRISFQIVESFVGSLDRDGKNPNTGATTFIDTLVNEQSEYVNIFTNCFPTDALKKKYNEDVDIFVMPHDKADVASLGFYEGMVEEDIDISESILKALDIVYDKVTDINERDLDIVVDGGISNIAQFIKTVYGKKGFYDPASPDAALWKCKKDNDVKMWKTVIMKMDNFCKNVRKDCMFIADGPRPYCLQGQKKIVRPSKPKNTIDVDILPFTKYLTGINTSYGAGYCDWFQIADEFSGDYFWCPPSIKACGVYIFTDLNFEYWDAPAGLNRGIIAALDVAFSPTNKQAGQIYTKNWNYAINYPQEGIVLEGQKTLQSKPSALDRVNVRRLLLRLERATYKILRYVVYEGNTAYMRQRVVDLLDPYFKEAKIGGGLYDYKIICDESNNTPDTIDRNELHISIGVKPTKTIEFIICNFVILSTGASWDEM